MPQTRLPTKPKTARKAHPVAIRASRGELAYRKLFGAIENGSLRPGTRLREVELSEWVGASRTPIREALGRLEGDGLVARDPSGGIIVAQLDQSMVAELYVMREVLEGTAAGLAARHASDAEIDTLRELARRDRDVGDDPARLARCNRLFHEAVFRCAHNRYLIRAVLSLRQSMVLLGQTTLAIAGRPETARAEHDAIVEAIARRDAEAAVAAGRAHIRAAYRARLGLMLET